MPSYDRGYPRSVEKARKLGRVLPVFEHAPMLSDRVLDASDVIPLDATEQPIEDAKPVIADDHHEASASD